MLSERELVESFPGTVHRIGAGPARVALVDERRTLLLLAVGRHDGDTLTHHYATWRVHFLG